MYELGRRLPAAIAVLTVAAACSSGGPDGVDTATERSIAASTSTIAGGDERSPSTAPTTAAPEPEASTTAVPESASSTVTTEPAGEAPGTDDAPAASDPPPADEPATELDLLVDELIAFVESERGHSFVSRPVVELFDGDDFVAEYAAVLAREAERNAADYRDATDIYQALGIIEETRDLVDIFASFADAGVLGFYDHPTERIVLRNDGLNPLTETVLVHELVHALDDQIFDLDRPEYDERTDEIGWTFTALIEGNATVIEDRYRRTLTEAELAAERDARRSLPRGVSLSSFSNSFLEIQFSPYEVGESWVSGLWADGGRAAVDAAFAEPPGTSEQVISALSGSLVTTPDPPAPPPVADATVFEEGLFGQIGWTAVLLDTVDPVTATEAADGWGGDWFVAWREGDRACVRAHVAADTPSDLDELALALERWVAAGDREIFYPTADLIRVTACG